jgi:hypothetical protein
LTSLTALASLLGSPAVYLSCWREEPLVFRIKKEQMEFFNEKTRAAFRRRMTSYLRESYAECVVSMSDAELDAWVDEVLRKAEKHRVRAEPDVAQLMLLFLLLGSDADERHDWVADALSNRNLNGAGKVRRLVRFAREHDVDALESVLVFPEYQHEHPEVDDGAGAAAAP